MGRHLQGTLADALGLKFPIHDQFRVRSTERFRDVAVPADRTVGFKNLRKLLGAELFPLHRGVIGTKKRGDMIEMVNRAHGPVAEYATLAFVPLGDDIPHQAILRIDLDLLQALLATVLTFGPARTFLEVERGFCQESSNGGLSDSHLNRFGLVSLGAGNESFPAVIEVRPKPGNSAKYEEPNSQYENRNDDEQRDRHRSPLGRRGLSSLACSEVAGPSCKISVLRESGNDGALRHPKM
jgi:hypothetical protein